MLKKEFVDMMRNDEELQELRRKVYSITGQLKDLSLIHISEPTRH